MYLMYVDESGDPGLPGDGSPSRFFCLSGVVVHELRWQETMSQLIQFRRYLRSRYNVYLEDELHTAELINKPQKVAASFQTLKKHERLDIVRQFADEISRLQFVRIINVVVDKQNTKAQTKDDVFRGAWVRLFQRFENTIRYANFPGPPNLFERGLVFPDSTDVTRLRKTLNDMRSRNRIKVNQRSGAFTVIDNPVRHLIEDPVPRDSRHSYLVQAADCAVYLLKQHYEPNAYMRRVGGGAYFRRMLPVLCMVASQTHPLGIVTL